MSKPYIQLTSAEIASIWASYMNDSMSKCILGYFQKTVVDQEINKIIQYAYDLTSTHIEKLTSLFQKEKIPLPTGFNFENDVNLNAPPLYTDAFMTAAEITNPVLRRIIADSVPNFIGNQADYVEFLQGSPALTALNNRIQNVPFGGTIGG